MAANISDTDVIIDTEGITVPECAHGMTFFKLIPYANNCYWIFSLKSDKGLPTSATGISIDISLLVLKIYSYSYLLHIYQIVAWHAFLILYHEYVQFTWLYWHWISYQELLMQK